MMSRRRWLQKAVSLAMLALLPVTLAGCGSSDGGENVTALEIGCNGDELAFDRAALQAPAGASVALTFTNRSSHHQHNWVLVNGTDEEAMAVYEAALVAGPKNNWLPANHAHILVHTPLLASGTNATVRFQAPERAGDYRYLCTFPGHFLAGMKGTLTVT